MSINQAEIILENRFFNDITNARRDLEQLKTRQLLGADSLVTKSTAEIIIGRVFDPNGLWYFNLQYIGYNEQAYLAEPGVALFDTDYANPTNRIPTGANMNDNKKAVICGFRENYKDNVASDGRAQKTYLIWVWNYGPLTRTIYTKVKVFYPSFDITDIASS
jgi:hypothetical protein